MFCLEPVGKRPKGAAPYTTLVPRGEDRPYFVGRVEETCAIHIDHHDVSRKHASLEVTTFQSFLNENPGARHYFTLWRESREQEQQQQQQQEGHNVGDIVGGGDSGEESGGSGGVIDTLVEELLLSPLLRIRNLSRFGTKIQVIPNFHSDQATPESEERGGGARSFVLRDSEGEHVEHNNFGSNLSLKDASMLNNSYGGTGAAGSSDGAHGGEEEVVPRYVYIPSVTHDQYILSFGQSAHFKVSFRPVVASIATLHYTPEYVFELTQMFRQLGCTILDGGLPQPQVQRINYAEVFLRVNEDEDLMFAIHNEAAAVMATETAVTMMGATAPSFVDHSPHPKHSQDDGLEMAGVEGLVEPSTSPIREVSRGRSAGAIDHPNEDGLVEDESGVVSLRDLAGGSGEVDPSDKERIRLERAHARREVESRVNLQTKLVEFFADQLQEVVLRPLSLIHVCDEIDDSVSTLQALCIGYMIALPAYVFELFALVAENPIRPLHVLPHPSVGSGGASAEPLRKRAVYGSAPYVHSVPTSCPISLHPIPESSTAPRTRRELFRDRCIYLPTIPLQRKNGAAIALGGGRVVTYTDPPSAKADFKAKLEASQLAEHQRQLKEEEEATRRNTHEGDETDGTESDADAAARRSTTSSSFYHQHNGIAAPTVTSFVAGTAAATQQALMLTNNCIIDVEEDGDLPLGALYVGKYVVVSEVLEQQVKELYLYAQDMYAQYQRYPLATILNSAEALNQVIFEPSVVAELKDVLLAVHRGWMPVAERSVHVSLLSNAFVLHSSVVEEIVIMAVEEQQQLGLHIKGMESTGADMVQNEIESQRRRDMLVRVFGATLANDDSTVRDMLLQEHNDALFAQLSEDKARKYGVMAEEVMLAAPNRLGGGLMRSTGNKNSSLRVMDEQNNGGSLGGFVAANRHADTYESVFNPDGRMMRRSMPVVDRGGEGVGGLTPTDSLGTRNTPGAFPKEDLKKGIPLGLLKGRLNPFHRNKHFDPLLDGANTATSKRLGDEAASYNNGEYYNEGEEDVDSDATPSSIDSDEHNLNHKKVPEGRFTRELKLYNEGNEYKRLVLLAYNNSQNVLLRESAKLRALHANVLASAQRRETQRHQQLQHNSSITSFSPRTPRGGNSKQPQQSSLSGQSVSWLHALLAQHCTPQLELLERLALYKESRNPTINDVIEGELLLGPKGGVTSSSPHRRMANHNKDATGGFNINSSSTISKRTRGLYNSNLKAADGGGDQQSNWMDGERREKGTGLLLETLWDEAEEIRILGEACLSQHAREVGYVTTDGGYVAPLRYESDFARQVDEILNSEAALGIKSLDTINTQSSLCRMRGGALSSSSRLNNSKTATGGFSPSSRVASPASRASPKRTNTPSKQSNKNKNASGVQRRLEVSDAAISDIQTLGTSRQLNVPSSGVSVDGNRRFALLSSHLAAVEHNNLRNNNAGDGSYNRNGSASISAGAGASPNHVLGESSTAGLARKPIARGTALARYPPLPLFATQEIHRNPRLASAALTSPHTAGTVATGGVRNQRGGPVTQQYMGRDPITAHLSASEALTAKLCEAVPPTDLKGVARRRVHFVKKYGRDEGEKRFTLWLGGQTPIWNREFYRSLDRNNLTLHGLFERGW